MPYDWTPCALGGDDGAYVAPARWGHDHWSTLLYLETRAVDHKGVVGNANMRTNARLHRALCWSTPLGGVNDGSRYPTRLKGGEELAPHDDWSILEDFAHFGLLSAWQRESPVARARSPFGFVTIKVKLHAAGAALAAQARAFKAEADRSWDEFAADLSVIARAAPAAEEVGHTG